MSHSRQIHLLIERINLLLCYKTFCISNTILASAEFLGNCLPSLVKIHPGFTEKNEYKQTNKQTKKETKKESTAFYKVDKDRIRIENALGKLSLKIDR